MNSPTPPLCACGSLSGTVLGVSTDGVVRLCSSDDLMALVTSATMASPSELKSFRREDITEELPPLVLKLLCFPLAFCLRCLLSLTTTDFCRLLNLENSDLE